MGRVFRRTDDKPLPPHAVVQRDGKGKEIATWTIRGRKFRAEVLPCGQKYLWQSPYFTIEYLPHDGSSPVRKATKCTDKAWAERYLRDVEIVEANKRIGIFSATHEHQQEARKKPVTQHIDDYISYLQSAGRTAPHIRDIGTKLRTICAEGQIGTLDDLRLSTVQAALAAVVQKKKLSDQTQNHYVAKIRAFMSWLIEDGRLADNPLKKIKKGPVLERHHERRTLAPQEFEYLIRATQTRTRSNQKVSGEDRVRFYYLMACTGYRLSEVGSLTAGSFALREGELVVTLPPKTAKNRKQDSKAIPADLAGWLWQWLADKPKTERLFNLPHKPIKALRRDMAAGRAIWISEAQTHGEREEREESDFLAYKNSDDLFADHHAFRYAYCSSVQRHTTSPAVTLKLQRHSDLKIGQHYWRSTDSEMARVQNEIGRQLPAPPGLCPAPSASLNHGDPVLAQCTVQCAPTETSVVPASHYESNCDSSETRTKCDGPQNAGGCETQGDGFPNHGSFSFYTPAGPSMAPAGLARRGQRQGLAGRAAVAPPGDRRGAD